MTNTLRSMLKWKSYSGKEHVSLALRKDVHRFWRVRRPPRSPWGKEDGGEKGRQSSRRVIWGNAWMNDKTDWTLGSRWHTRGSEPPKECNRWQGKAMMTHSIRLWLPVSLCVFWLRPSADCSTPKGWKCLDWFSVESDLRPQFFQKSCKLYHLFSVILTFKCSQPLAKWQMSYMPLQGFLLRRKTNTLPSFQGWNLWAVFILRCHRREQQGYNTVQLALIILNSSLGFGKSLTLPCSHPSLSLCSPFISSTACSSNHTGALLQMQSPFCPSFFIAASPIINQHFTQAGLMQGFILSCKWSHVSFSKLHLLYKPEPLVPPCCDCMLLSAPGSSRWRRSRSCHHHRCCCPGSPSPA